ncbi:MAG TPA: hypothetical protein VFM35_03560 [Candidatus Binatia bacterium]|nr:hypothetical protein [Candidatus Binatia bacterium]
MNPLESYQSRRSECKPHVGKTVGVRLSLAAGQRQLVSLRVRVPKRRQNFPGEKFQHFRVALKRRIDEFDLEVRRADELACNRLPGADRFLRYAREAKGPVVFAIRRPEEQ